MIAAEPPPLRAILCPSSFRDRSGFVYRRDGRMLRQVNAVFRDDFDHFLGSGLYDTLIREQLIVPHEEIDTHLAYDAAAYKVLQPEIVQFISYPYEWCFSQLKAAALTTLRLQELALLHGMTLKDASAFNIQFHQGRPVLIDTLSFSRLVEGRPWAAYRQFCQHFLAPLALAAYRDPRLLNLTRLHLDGVPVDLAAKLLPARARLNPSLFLHLFCQATARSVARRSSIERGARSRYRFSPAAIGALTASLSATIARLRWTPRGIWTRYYQDKESYSQEAFESKKAIVAEFVRAVGPHTAWDLGMNTGFFCGLLLDQAPGCFTVGWDSEPECVEAAYAGLEQRRRSNFLPLCADLTNPSPAIGWNHDERMSLRERGKVDLVQALALIHHLVLGSNLTFARIAEFLASLTTWLVIEFVPKTDPQAQRLLTDRDDVFSDYTEAAFQSSFERFFRIARRVPLVDSPRCLYLMRLQR